MKTFIKKFTPFFLLDWYHFILAFLGAFFYHFPSKKIKVIGVTGTNGKTTTTEMIAKIFEEAGYRVALMNSIRFKIGEKEWLNALRMTMPGRFKIQRFLRQAVVSRCQYAVLEVTSEGIKQHRHRFIDFEIAVFTNLAPEHIEAHGGFEKYRAAKGKLFQACKNIHIINRDDPNASYFLQFPALKKILYSKKDKNSLLHSIRLLGEFNIYNALAAIKVGLTQGVDLATCQKAIEKIGGIPGRMEEVISKPFKVFVDYAFTPNALEKVYQTLTQNFNPSAAQKLICLFGACGGGRDKWKRPILGEIADKYCQKIILTNEDPYDEDPMEIIKQIEKGIKNKELGRDYWKILDRRAAIKKSLELASQGDVVVITGKGCEPSIVIKGEKIPWDDRKVVREEFNRLYRSI